MRRPALLALGLALGIAACAPDAWSPGADHRREVAARADALAAHLQTLPGITHASVVIDAPDADPLAPPSPPPVPHASVVLALAPGADADRAADDARRAVSAAFTGLTPDAVTVVAAAPAPSEPLADLGPFRVGAGSRTPLLATFAAALAVIAALAVWLALVGARRRSVS